jgi:uncharacterized phage protein gp47/JayE
MPFERPTLPQLVSQIETDIDSRLPEAGARAPRSVAGVLARTVAGVIHGLHGYLAWMARQVFVDTAEAEFLDDHARIWGIPRRPAVAATGSLVVTGTAGASVPAGAVLQATDGRRYEVAVGGIIAGAGTVEVPIVAQEAAAAYALPAGASLSFVTPLPGVESRGTVAAGGIGGGADQEADHSLRGRILDRIRQPAQGGARHDYVVWAGQVSGVGSRPDGTPAVWVSPGEMGLGTVVVRLLAEGGGIPDAQLVAAVQTHLDQVRPVTAEVIVVAPVPVPLDVTIANLNPSTPEVRAAIEVEIADLLARSAAPGATILLSHIRAAISTAAGEDDHDLIEPATNVTHAPGEIAVMGSVSWV